MEYNNVNGYKYISNKNKFWKLCKIKYQVIFVEVFKIRIGNLKIFQYFYTNSL